MESKKVVSIIAPVYNGESYLERFLDSILAQTYNNIELVIVNDGSYDKTAEILKDYESKMANRGYKFIVITQDNKGVAGAINAGLAVFTGDYMMWTDADDYMLPQNVEKKVSFLEKNLQYDLALCDSCQVNSENMQVYRKNFIPKRMKINLENVVNEKIVHRGTGTSIVRRDAFLKAIPSRQIYESRNGQNFQLLIPLVYLGKCGYIDEILHHIIVRKDSLESQKRTYEQTIEKIYDLENLLLNVISTLPKMPEREKQIWNNRIKEKYAIRRLRKAYIECETDVEKFKAEIYAIRPRKKIFLSKAYFRFNDFIETLSYLIKKYI